VATNWSPRPRKILSIRDLAWMRKAAGGESRMKIIETIPKRIPPDQPIRLHKRIRMITPKTMDIGLAPKRRPMIKDKVAASR